MSKVVKSISSIFGAPDVPKRDISRNATTIGGQLTPEQMAEQRAALAAQGRRPDEEEAGGQRAGVRPLQGSGTKSSYWV